MADRTTRPFRKLPRKYLFIILAALSGIISAIWVAIDTFVTKGIVVDSVTLESNEYAFAIQSMIIGFLVSVLFVLLLWIPISKKPFEELKMRKRQKRQENDDDDNVQEDDKQVHAQGEQKRHFSFLGQFIDPQFQGIYLPTKRMFLWLTLSGLFSGIQTLVYFILIKRIDISVFLPAAQFVVVYLIIGDLIVDKSKPATVEVQSIVMIVLGVILAAIELDTTSSSLNWFNLLMVFIVFNGSSAVYVIFQKKLTQTKDHHGRNMDSTNIRLWTLVFMALFTILFTIPFMRKTDWFVFKTTFVRAIFPVALSMLLVYVSRIFYIRALAMGKMSIVNSLASISVIAGIPITVILSFIWPQYFQITSNWLVWLLRGIGAILVFTGIVGLSLSEVKIVILGKVKPGEKCDFEQIKEIPGVEKVSILTGEYDLMIILRTRTIGRGYQSIVARLELIPCIDVLVSSTILKEWSS